MYRHLKRRRQKHGAENDYVFVLGIPFQMIKEERDRQAEEADCSFVCVFLFFKKGVPTRSKRTVKNNEK